MENDKKSPKGKVTKVVFIVLLFVITNVASFFAGGMLSFNKIMPWISSTQFSKEFSQIKDIGKYKELFAVRETLIKRFDGNIDDSKLVEGAIKGMTAALDDKYTYYMNKDEYKQYKEEVDGSFVGIGIRVSTKNNKIYVAEPIKGSPAEKAGIKAGDYIIKVNGKEYSGEEKDKEKAISVMKGKTGEKVTLTIERNSKTFDIEVVRGQIINPSVEGEMLNNNIGYISVSGFELNTAKDFNAKLKELKLKGMKGLIMDLRDNGGGYLNVSVDLVSNFIQKDKLVVSTIDKYKNKQESFSKGGDAIGMPLVVLVNGNSASASEVVSGALRDYKAATFVGVKTFGKGIVQTTFENKTNGSALKMTISKYYSPLGINIHKKGIQPDVTVEYPKELIGKKYDRSKDPQFKKALELIEEKTK